MQEELQKTRPVVDREKKNKSRAGGIGETAGLFVPALFLLCAGLFFFGVGEDAQIAVQDNLDLFQAQFQMLKNTKSFGVAPGQGVAFFLHGVSRDVLPSEWQLPGILYRFFPAYAAYVLHYLWKVALGTLAMVLLQEEVLGADCVARHRTTALFTAFAYGLISFFPAFGSAFAAIPLAGWLFLKLARAQTGRKKALLGAALFFYPALSYFSYFGLFLIGFASLAWLWLWITQKKIRLDFLAGIAALTAGFVLFERRLFALMFLSTEPTIRETMQMASLSGKELWSMVWEGFAEGMFHAPAQQRFLVMPIGLLWLLGTHLLWRKETGEAARRKKIGHFLLGFLLFNSLVYGLYYWAPVRLLVETILPPLKGWQFNRTMFFNPCLWYLLFAVALIDVAERIPKTIWKERIAAALAVLAAALVLLLPARYNDLRNTARACVYEMLRGEAVDDLSYREFYATELFAQICEDIDYQGEWSLAYGLHPAVLEYNGIHTLDGYLGFYPQAYKEAFREIIAPALKRQPETAAYYDDWGARCYLYSGEEGSVVQAVRRYAPAQETDHRLYVDPDAVRALDGRYLFSRIPLANAAQLGLSLRGDYTDDATPYHLYVYDWEAPLP